MKKFKANLTLQSHSIPAFVHRKRFREPSHPCCALCTLIRYMMLIVHLLQKTIYQMNRFDLLNFIRKFERISNIEWKNNNNNNNKLQMMTHTHTTHQINENVWEMFEVFSINTKDEMQTPHPLEWLNRIDSVEANEKSCLMKESSSFRFLLSSLQFSWAFDMIRNPNPWFTVLTVFVLAQELLFPMPYNQLQTMRQMSNCATWEMKRKNRHEKTETLNRVESVSRISITINIYIRNESQLFNAIDLFVLVQLGFVLLLIWDRDAVVWVIFPSFYSFFICFSMIKIEWI